VSVRGTADAESGVAVLVREFPGVALDIERQPPQADTPLPTFDLARWNDANVDFEPFDTHVEDITRRGPATIVLRGERLACVRAAQEMLTRWQRLLGRRNTGSRTRAFDDLLARFGALHDLEKPPVRADYRHALDTWQWTLRLAPDVPASVQIAALLHDIERLESEADARVEPGGREAARAPVLPAREPPLAVNYAAFKAEHAQRSARIALEVARASGFDAATCARAARLVETHESTGAEPDRALLNDADALSFFSQTSSDHLDCFGTAHTRRKIAFSLGRMSAGARARLETVRLRADVARLLCECRGVVPTASAGRQVNA
jgi:hypothetical protein